MGTEELSVEPRSGPVALVILLLPLLMMALAAALYHSGWGTKLATREQGQLLPSGLTIELLGMTPEQLQGHWGLLMLAPRCELRCQELLLQTEQVHRALGRDIPRVRRWLLSSTQVEEALLVDLPPRQWQQLKALPPELTGLFAQQLPLLILVDPLGNLVLAYGMNEGGKPLLKDLKRLLKVSQIG